MDNLGNLLWANDGLIGISQLLEETGRRRFLDSRLPVSFPLVAAWQAAVFGTIIAAIYWHYPTRVRNLAKAKKDKRRKAEIGYQLLDSMFDDEWSGQMLYLLDSINPVSYKGSY